MTTQTTTPALDSKQKRFKGSLAGTLVRTLLVFTFIPLALMAGAAYFRARSLLREQAISQSRSLLNAQLNTIGAEVNNKEAQLGHLLESGDFTILIELALHANPQSSEFSKIRNSMLNEFEKLNAQENAPAFSQFILLDTNGNVKISSNAQWQGATLAPVVFNQTSKNHSRAFYGLSPIYKDQLILVTAFNYKTARGSMLGTIMGITEKENLKNLIQPLNGLSPLAKTYFILSNEQFIYSDATSGEFALVDAAAQIELTSKLSELIQQETLQPEFLDTTAPTGEATLAQIQWFPTMQSGVVLEMNSADIYGRITSLAPFTIILVLGTLIATSLVVILSINRVIKPLRALSEITQGFAEGDWSRRAEVLSDDEVGFLASSFNRMASDLGESHRALEQKVDERTRQIYTAAEVAQSFTTLSSLDEMFNKTVDLLVKQFGFYQASVFMLDRSGKYLEFKTGAGPATKGLAEKKYRLEVGSASIMGWVSANNKARVASDVLADELHLKNELLQQTRSEATVPIAMSNKIFGVLDAQSAQPSAFSEETVVMLQTLASQLATAIQTVELSETSQVNFEELARLYRSSQLVAKINNETDALVVSSQILNETPYPVVIFRVQEGKLEVFSFSDPTIDADAMVSLPKYSAINTGEIEKYLSRGTVITTSKSGDIPVALKDIIKKLGVDSVAYLPIRKSERIAIIVMIGTRKGVLSNASIQPYTNLADLMTISMEKADAIQQTERHLREMESLASINEAISTSSDLQSFFKALQGKVRQIIGDYNMFIALYDGKNEMVNVPFSYMNGQISTMESFPLGDDLTSILISTLHPLMLVENIERKAAELGAKTTGKLARSWMGAPMLVQNKPIGALVLQDFERERAFDENDLKFFTTITGQVAGVINNVHLLEESQHRALQLETAAEIARDISGSLNIDELLIKAVNFIRERFDFYHAAVFLHDLPKEFAVIREATGEAGAQMKRSGYKIGVGSKSIVGFVSSRGEQLVVNDTAKDATYYANPLFPDTRAEAAIPMKVGERILGVLDVQSAKPYAFSVDNLRSLQILADQIAIAVINTELFAETQENLSQHRLLHHITTTVASGTTLEEALESAVSGLQVTLGGDRVTIMLADREKKILEIKASVGYAEDITHTQIAIGDGVTGWAAAHRKPLRIKDVTVDSRYMQLSSNTRSELAIPLIYRNELLGVLNVESEQVDAYTENDEEMLGTLGGSLAAIIANARLLEQIRQQAERERVVYEVTSKIRRSTDIQSIMMATANELMRVTGARYAKLQVTPESDKGQAGSL